MAEAQTQEGHGEQRHQARRAPTGNDSHGLDQRARAAWADHAGPTEVYVQDRMRQLRSAGVKGDFGLYEGYSPPDYTMGPDHSGRPPLEGGALHQLVSAPGEAQNLHQDPRQATSSLRLGPTPAHHQRGWRSADFAHLPPASAGSADTAISSPFTASVPHLRRHSDGSAMFPSSSVSALEGEAATSRYTDSDGVGLVSGSGGASAYSDHRRGSRGPSGWGPYPGPEPTTSGLVPWAGVSRGPNRSRAEYGEGGDAGSQPTGFRLQSLDDHLYHQYRLQPTATRAKRLGDAADDSEMAGLLGLPASEPLEAGTGYNQLGTTPVLDEVGGAEIDGQFYSSLGVNGLSRQSHGAVAAGSPSQNMGSGGRRSAEVRPRQHGAGLALLGLVGGRWPSEGGGHSSGPAADSDEGYGRELYQGNGRQHDSSAQRQHQHHASQLMGQQQQGQHTPPTSMLPPVAGSYSAASRPLLAGTAHSVRSSYPWPGLPEAVATPGGQAPGIDVGSIFGDMPDNSGRHGDVNNTAGIVGGIPGAVTGEGKMGQRRQVSDFTPATPGTCMGEGCERRPRYAYKGSKKLAYCAAHRLVGMVDMRHPRCKDLHCAKQPSFGMEGDRRPSYCATHKKEGMINVSSRRCQRFGCIRSPNFGYQGDKRASYCKGHSEPGMIDVVSRRCGDPSCTRRPLYNMSGLRPVLCREHKLPGMIDVVSARCQEPGCLRHPSFGYASENKARRCAKHRLEGMEGLKGRRQPKPSPEASDAAYTP